jgi:MYXO-CTERM domain-containing protein
VAACGAASRDGDSADASVDNAPRKSPAGDGVDRADAAIARPDPALAAALGALGALGAGPSSTCLTDTTGPDFQGGVLTNCDAATSPGDVILAQPPVLDQVNTTVGSAGFGITATTWGGQTFIPTLSGPVVRIDLDLFCAGCSGTTPDLTVSLRATTGSPALPTGADLATATITGFSNGGGAFFTANFATPFTVTAGTQYAVLLHPNTNPSSGIYAYLCSCVNPDGNPYTNGLRVASSNSGSSWTADSTVGGRDMGFKIFISNGFAASGTLVSSSRDGNPGVGEATSWTTLSWSATTPALTTLQFQAAASNDPTGPFTFVGPDGTSGTFFSNGGSLSQFDGNRYLRYQAILASTDNTQTPTLQDVTACFDNVPAVVTTTLTASPASAAFGGTVGLTAVLTGNSAALGGRSVVFTFNSVAAGTATTDATGTATISGVSLTGIEPGVYTGAIAASYAGETGFLASSGSADLTVTKAAQTLSFAALSDRVMTDGGFTLSATGGASGNAVTFSTLSTACSVSGTTVTLLSAGSCSIQADQAGNAEYNAAAPATQSFNISLASQTIAFPAIASFSWGSGSATLAATASSGLAVTYTVQSGPCSVAGSTLTATGAGSCVVAASQAGNALYSAAAEMTATATVSKADQVISFPAVAGFSWSGGSALLAATASSALAVSYSVVSGPCSVSGLTLTASAAGTCVVAADQGGSADYNAATQMTASVVAGKVDQVIGFSALSDRMATDPSFTLAATGGASGNPVVFSTSSAACSVTGDTVALVSGGSCAIQASQAGDGDYNAAAPVIRTFAIGFVAQTVVFPAVSGFAWKGGSATLAATASSDLAVSYSVVSGRCQISGATLTATGGGTCVVAANQPGNARYSEAPQVTVTVTVARVEQMITFPPIEPFGEAYGSDMLMATSSSGLAVTYQVQSGPCVISGTLLRARTGGTCVIAADQAGDADYNAAPEVTASVEVGDHDNGCGCRSTNPGATSVLSLLVVAVVWRRRRRALRA